MGSSNCLETTILALSVIAALFLPSNYALVPTAFLSPLSADPRSKAIQSLVTLPSVSTSRFVVPPRHHDNHNEEQDFSGDGSNDVPRLQKNETFDNGGNSDVENNEDEITSKRIRLAKAQAEIDRILNNPIDPPFDFESEMKKVVSISPPLISEGSSEYELEEQVSQMEDDLYSAVKAQDFTTAQQKQSEISQLHVDDCGLVLQLNSAFYKAFSNKDYREMDRIWLKDRSCVCILPSFKPISGVADIMRTWKRMFESSFGSFQRSWIDPCEIQLTVKATMAVVTCEEHVYARRFVRGKKRESAMVNKLMATNIYRKVGGKWHMTYHHSSWHADSEAAQIALKRGNSGMMNSPKSGFLSKYPVPRIRLLEEDNDEPTGLENILGVGNSGPLLGDGSNKKEEGTPKRIIMGPLKSGSLFDDMLSNLINRRNMQGSASDGNDDDATPGAIIHFSRIEGEDDDEDDDEADEEEDDNETYEIYDEGSNDGESDSLRSWAKKQNRKMRKQQRQSVASFRQECINSLRKLTNEGRISAKQKRVLLTDIINCSSQGKTSTVEVAYELLCGEGRDPEEAEEEFVDQCQVFARSLSDTTNLI